MKPLALLSVSLALVLTACVEPSQKWLEKPLFVERASAPTRTEEDFTVRLDSARLAFGPLYLCAGARAGDACETARLEWLDSRIVELVGEGRIEVGELAGLSGDVRSWMADYGFVSKLTETKPVALEAAKELGASLVLRGVATGGTRSLPFEVRLTITASETTGKGRPAISMPAAPSLLLPMEDDGRAVVVSFPLTRWLEGLEPSLFFVDGECVDGVRVVCSGNVERRCDAEGGVEGETDCSVRGLSCIPERGCGTSLEADETTELGRRLALAITGGGRPTLTLAPR